MNSTRAPSLNPSRGRELSIHPSGLPGLLKAGFASAVAYRAELIVWALSNSMPVIMLALFQAVAADGPMGRFGAREFTAYFLGTFIVRQLTGSWLVWQLNEEIRHGTLGMRLLKPIHPLLAYGAETLSAIPLRVLISLPVALISLYFAGANAYTHDPVLGLLWIVSVAGAWLITLMTNFLIGTLAFYLESSLKVMDIWLALYFVLSGYLVPVELFPGWLRTVTAFLPFRYQLALPVEIMTGALGRGDAVQLLVAQWVMLLGISALSAWFWRRGLARFEAFGG